MAGEHRRWWKWLALLGGMLAVSAVFSLAMGPADIPFREIWPILRAGRHTTEYSILFQVRLPRILLGMAIGGALSVSGVILQGMFRNPLVEPYTLGISGGAALGAALFMVFNLPARLPFLSLPVAGFTGAITVIGLVYALSVKRGNLSIPNLLLTGVMISFISSSLIMLLMAVARVEDLPGIIYWVMGSLQQARGGMVTLALVSSLAGLTLAWAFSLPLNAFSLGEEEAHALGINTQRTKKVLFALAAGLTGLSVSAAGIIGFVGLVVPHFVRLFLGPDHRVLLPASFLCGALFLILCDTLARTVISPVELPVGVITGIVGGTLFVCALSRRRLTL